MANTNFNFFCTSSTTSTASLPTATVTPLAAPAAPTNQPSSLFGSLTSAAPQSSVSFGSTPAPTSISFGNTPASTSISFGTTPALTSTSMPTFGAPSSFSSNLSQTNPATNTLSFGLTSSGGLNQPSITSSSAPLLSVPPLKPVQTGISAGIPFTTASQIATSTTPTSTLNLFGKTTSSVASSTLTLPTTMLSSTPAVTASSSFSALGSSLNTAATTSTANLFGTTSAPATSATPVSSTFMWQKPTSTTTAPSIGLGGIDHTAVATAHTSPNTIVSVKEQPLPSEIQQTVVSFKEYVKTQKNLSNELARSSGEPLTKLTHQISSLNNLILTLGSILSQQKFTAEKIKMETIDSLNDYELAQKIKDSPVASEDRMLLIRKFFSERISAFEECTKVLQEKIEYVYRHVITLPQENSLSAEALKIIVKKLHDSFVVISARAYKLHNDMQLLKVQYLTLRNHYIKDNSSISFNVSREFELPFNNTQASRAKLTDDFANVGPNPFSRSSNGSFNALLLSSQNKQFPPTSTGKEWNLSGLGNVSRGSLGFSELAAGNTSSFGQQTPFGGQQFNLQKSSFSSKRGKR